jgi:hypothetical protein
MDVYCKRCGEPWDLYGVQHGDMTATERDSFWSGEGCPSCHGKAVEKRPLRADLTSALHEILGDDVDGLAAELEDAEFLLGGEFWG